VKENDIFFGDIVLFGLFVLDLNGYLRGYEKAILIEG